MSGQSTIRARAGGYLAILSFVVGGCSSDSEEAPGCPAGFVCTLEPNETGDTGGGGGVGGNVAAVGGSSGSAGNAGTGGTAGTAGAASGGASTTGGAPAVATGEPCDSPEERRCLGEAQVGLLECRNGFLEEVACERGLLCDRETASCQPVIRDCAARDPGDAFCDGSTRIECGPDLVSVTEEECDTGCVAGECVEQSCGDGIVASNEACDDGNDDDTDDCLSNCRRARCGDGIIQDGVEECDDGNRDETDDCRSDCMKATCGDGVVWKDHEDCDDENDVDDDDCPSNCHEVRCGDDYVVEGVEDCEDGNETSGDGCSESCRAEVVALELGADHSCAILADQRLKCWGSNARGQLGFDTDGETAWGRKAEQMGKNLPSVLDEVTQVSAGSEFTCALSGGDVWCWGDNLRGQLGRGTTIALGAKPEKVDIGGTAKSICTAERHACVLTHEGTVKCWGDATYGQLGVDPLKGTVGQTPGDMGDSLEEVDLSGPAYALDCGGNTTCVVMGHDVPNPPNGSIGRSVSCWGEGAYGQLGPIAEDFTAEPQELVVPFNDELRRITVGGGHVCAYHPQGRAYCWGNNAHGQLVLEEAFDTFGKDASDWEGWRPSVVTNAETQDIVAFGQHTCSLVLNNARCFGEDHLGVLGMRVSMPDEINDFGDEPGESFYTSELLYYFRSPARSTRAIGLGGEHACAVLDTGAVYCWGDNAFGELGAGTEEPAFCDDHGEYPTLAVIN